VTVEALQSGRRLRAGVIGLGAGQAHMTGYTRADGVDLVAIAGKEKERLTDAADRFHVPHTFEDWEDLVAREDIDLVSVATPNALHAPIAIAALRAGKHVLCEKPLSIHADSAQQMVDAAVESGRVLQTAFNFRRRGDVRTLRQHLDTGALGRVYHTKSTWLRRSGIPGLGSWFTSKDLAGGGPLIDLGVHVLDLALFLLDEPRVVSVTAATYAGSAPAVGVDRARASPASAPDSPTRSKTSPLRSCGSRTAARYGWRRPGPRTTRRRTTSRSS